MRLLRSVFVLLIIMLMAGCSGGSGSNTPPSQTVSGVAATGTPISGTVYLKDSSNPAKEISTPINSDGSYIFDVSSLTAPFILKAVGTANEQNYTLYSLAGAPGVANINPLSHLAVVQANNGVDPASLYANLTTAQLQAIKTALAPIIPQIQALLQQILSQYGVSTTNFISDEYTANHIGLDLLFDMIAIIVNNGNLTMTNKVSGAAILTTTLSSNSLSGQVIIANIPTIAIQSLGAVYAYPANTAVASGGTTSFKAIVMGMSNQSVTWSVVEAGGGSITGAGVYSAPTSAGTYHIKATSATDTSKSATVTVTVSAAPTNGQMGGAIQGSSLSLTGAVSTLNSASGMFSGITTDGTSLFFTNMHSICKADISTGVITTIAGIANTPGSSDGTAEARFYLPYAITTDGTNLYVADSGNNTIRKIIISTGVVSTFAGSASASGSTDGIGTSARFTEPEGITTDGTYLYVADYGNYTIRKIVIATGAVTTFAGSAGSVGSIDGVGAAARFKSIGGITTDGSNIYAAESGAFLGLNNYSESGAIRKIVIATGVVTTIAGSATETGSTDGIGTIARFKQPIGITTDGTNLYLADRDNYTIRKVVISTGVVSTIAGAVGVSGATDATGINARFVYPGDITTDGKSLYVTDGSVTTGIIRKIQ